MYSPKKGNKKGCCSVTTFLVKMHIFFTTFAL